MCLWVIIFTIKMNKGLRYLFGIALWFAPMIASAAIPQGYYTSLNGKMGGDSDTQAYTDLPLGVRTMGNMIHFTCGSPHTDGCIYNAAGQLITRLPVIENNMEVTLPSGIYFITTNQMQRPIKIVAK